MQDGDREEVRVSCPCCGGMGTIPLTGAYERTLGLLKSRREEPSGADLARVDGCSNEAMCNRLMALKRMGLAECRRDGRQKLWRAK